MDISRATQEIRKEKEKEKDFSVKMDTGMNHNMKIQQHRISVRAVRKERNEKENQRMTISIKEKERKREESLGRAMLQMQLVMMPTRVLLLRPPLRMDGMLHGLDQANGMKNLGQETKAGGPAMQAGKIMELTQRGMEATKSSKCLLA